VVPKKQPGACGLFWPNLSLAEAIYLRHMRWTNWGEPTATAIADFKRKSYDPWTRVRVRAMARRDCWGFAFLYTRARVHFPKNQQHTWQGPNCTQVGFSPNPD
jgi:hypothetical protein